MTDADGRTTTSAIALTVADVDPVSISTGALPQGMSGVAYDQALAAFGGRAPYTWSVTNAPAGLAVNGDRLQGTPSAAGTEQVELKATDRDGRVATKTLALEILAPGISITNASLPTAQKDEAYDVALTALGGTAPYTWALDAGTLPAGLTLDPTTGHISGTPTTVESQALTLKVTSSDNATVTKQLTLAVANLAATPLDESPARRRTSASPLTARRRPTRAPPRRTGARAPTWRASRRARCTRTASRAPRRRSAST